MTVDGSTGTGRRKAPKTGEALVSSPPSALGPRAPAALRPAKPPEMPARKAGLGGPALAASPPALCSFFEPPAMSVRKGGFLLAGRDGGASESESESDPSRRFEAI